MEVVEIWNRYIENIEDDKIKEDLEYTAWHFSDNKDRANLLAKLAMEGKKKSCASLLRAYDMDEVLPKVGDINIILDWYGDAKCIIRTIDITIIPFSKVDEKFAKLSGEKDNSLKAWKDHHKKLFSRELKIKGENFTEDEMVVLEEFELLYAEKD